MRNVIGTPARFTQIFACLTDKYIATSWHPPVRYNTLVCIFLLH